MKSKELINWKQVSIELSGSDNSIRKNNIPKKHKEKIDRLLKLIELWQKWSNVV
jgi:hypothetical protein